MDRKPHSPGATIGVLEAENALRPALPRRLPVRDSLLTLAARPSIPGHLVPELRRRSALVSDWPSLLGVAEGHGLGPLLYHHLRQHSVEIPNAARRTLQGVYLRHRRVGTMYEMALEEALTEFEAKGVPALVLKGPALIPLVYADPAHRPVSDLDILIDERDAVHALEVLRSLGYTVELPTSRYHVRRHHHLRPASKIVDGTPLSIELHRDALSADLVVSMTLAQEWSRSRTFPVGGREGRTLGIDETLWHLCRHLVGLHHPFRLIWVSDIIGYTDRQVASIDWERLRRVHPFVVSTLELINHVTPLSARVVEASRVTLSPRPRQVCVDYRGWPRATATEWDGWSGRLSFCRETLAPPEWWLRLHYGAGLRGSGWAARVKHLAAVGRLVRRRAADFVPRRHAPPPARPST